MAVGYGLGSFPRTHFEFHSPQEEYYYNHYMYRRYGTRPADSNRNPSSPGNEQGTGVGSTSPETGNPYNIFQNPPPQSYDHYMNNCMKRTDLLQERKSEKRKRAAGDAPNNGDPDREHVIGREQNEEIIQSGNTTGSPLPLAEKLTSSTESPSQPRVEKPEEEDDEDIVSIMEIGYPALIEQLKARRCVELYMVYAEHHAQKQVQDPSPRSNRGEGQQSGLPHQALKLALSSAVCLFITSLILI